MKVADMESIEYNVVCEVCGQVFTPAVRSALWWKARKRAEDGYLDAYCCTGQECGCIQREVSPDAPFRIVGFDCMGLSFNVPFFSFGEAVRAFTRLNDNVVAYITGVSEAVKRKLEMA